MRPSSQGALDDDFLHVAGAFVNLAHACPCGRVDGKNRAAVYADCCGRFVDHFDTAPAPDAEYLMRSRYSAFVREDGRWFYVDGDQRG